MELISLRWTPSLKGEQCTWYVWNTYRYQMAGKRHWIYKVWWCRSVKCEQQREPPVESIGKGEGDSAWSNRVDICCLDKRSLILNLVQYQATEMMAVFPLAMIGKAEKQDGTELSLEKQTLPGGCECSYANWTLMGKGTMTHAWDNFHKDGSLLSTSIERCVDFLARSFLCCFSFWFRNTTNLRISHRSNRMHPKFSLNELWA